jgi:glycosyltransferase involved in cell wall biosynthesis
MFAPRVVVMMGPAPEGRGGMASVVAAYRDGGLFAQAPVHFIRTVSSGGVGRKLVRAALAWFALAGLLLRRRVALVHIHTASGLSFWRKALYCWTAWAARAPVLMHIHGGNFAEFAAGLGAPAQALLRSTFRRAAAVIVLSPTWVQRLAPWVPAGRLKVLANPVTPWRSGPRPHPHPHPHLLAQGGASTQRLLFVGRVEADKGVHVLLEAFSLTRPMHPGLELWLAGDGDLAGARAQARSLGIPEAALRFLGWVDGQHKRAAFDAADVYVSPSFIEGLPVAMLEAMHSGLPMVVTAVGSVPEVIEDGLHGVLVQAGDAAALAQGLGRVLQQPAQAAAMAQAATALFDARYSTPVVLRQLRACYGELAEATEPAG